MFLQVKKRSCVYVTTQVSTKRVTFMASAEIVYITTNYYNNNNTLPHK